MSVLVTHKGQNAWNIVFGVRPYRCLHERGQFFKSGGAPQRLPENSYMIVPLHQFANGHGCKPRQHRFSRDSAPDAYCRMSIVTGRDLLYPISNPLLGILVAQEYISSRYAALW